MSTISGPCFFPIFACFWRRQRRQFSCPELSNLLERIYFAHTLEVRGRSVRIVVFALFACDSQSSQSTGNQRMNQTASLVPRPT